MSFLSLLSRVAAHVVRWPASDLGTSASVPRETYQPAEEDGSTMDRGAFGFSGVPGDESIDSMTLEELLAWENRDIPNVHRRSDHAEAVADERQDVTTSLNYRSTGRARPGL